MGSVSDHAYIAEGWLNILVPLIRIQLSTMGDDGEWVAEEKEHDSDDGGDASGDAGEDVVGKKRHGRPKGQAKKKAQPLRIHQVRFLFQTTPHRVCPE